MTADERCAAASHASRIEGLLQAMVAFEEVHLVVKNAGVTAEFRGATRLSTGEEWLTIEVVGTPHHLHVRRGALQQAEFLTDGSKNCGVRFLGDGNQPFLTCYLPGTAVHRPGYLPSRRVAFDRIEAGYRDAAGSQRSEDAS